MEKAAAAEMENTAEVIKSTGIFTDRLIDYMVKKQKVKNQR